jgi:transcriptional regulator GlxA family with amidase domain
VGQSPAVVFRTLQINRAKALLGCTNEPTALIARAAAFGSERAFYRTFLDCTGLSPSSYRRRNRSERRGG